MNDGSVKVGGDAATGKVAIQIGDEVVVHDAPTARALAVMIIHQAEIASLPPKMPETKG